MNTPDQNFLKVIPVLINLIEGGYVNDPADPGGETKYGISKRSYPNLDIPNLTKAQAAQIYYTDYWLKEHCDAIPFPLCAYFFDTCVNQGGPEATKILQQTVGVNQDGKLGPITLAAATRLPAAQHYLYLIHRLTHYRTLAEWPRYGDGWTNRLLLLSAGLLAQQS